MKKIVILTVLFGLLFGITACVVHEQRTVVEERPGIPARLENQQQRIDQGISSGVLTRAEADIVQDNLNYIKNEFSAARAEGRLTPREVTRLERLLDQNSNMIYREKHNPVRRIY